MSPLQSEACGERSTSESSSNGVWQGEMLHVYAKCIDSANELGS